MIGVLQKGCLAILLLFALALVGGSSGQVSAQDKDRKKPPAGKKAGKPKPEEKGEAPKPGPDKLSDKQLRREIDAAIERGVEWLRKQQKDNGSFASHYPLGQTALVTLALLKCGVSPDDPAVVKAFTFMKGGCKNCSRPTYELSILLMALEAKYYNPAALKKHWEKYINNGQNRKKAGISTTLREKDKKGNRGEVNPFRPEVAKSDCEWARELVKYLIRAQRKNGGWRYGIHGNDTDNSCSQFACLGLLAARRLGVPIPEKVFLRALDYWLRGQCKGKEKVKAFPVPAALLESFKHAGSLPKNAKAKKKKKGKKTGMSTTLREKNPEGFSSSATGHRRKEFIARGWSYWGNTQWGTVYGSMTTAGLAGLIICKSELAGSREFRKKLRAQTNGAIEDGAAWLAKYFSFTGNPRQSGKSKCDYYYMYGLERAGMLAGCKKFGEHDWYREGAVALIKNQSMDGSWADSDAMKVNPLLPPANIGRGQHVYDTCFALLFLARATMPVIEKPDGTIYTGGDLFKKKGKKEDSKEKTAGEEEKKQAELTQEKVDNGVKLAANYLLGQQNNNGSFGSKHSTGCTAIAAVAFLKGGLGRKHPAVRKALEYLGSCDTKTMQVHESALVLMALEAAYCDGGAPPGRKVKTPSSIRKWAKKLAVRIVELKRGHLVPGCSPQSYYACMGLKAARRLGVKIPDKVFLRTLMYWLEGQCKEGEKVGAFLVPAAQIDSSGFRKTSSKKRRGKTREDEPAVCREFAARGWCYPKGSTANGSITVTGLASLVICKSELAGNKTFEKKFRTKTDKAIEDASAWLAKHFGVKDVPLPASAESGAPAPFPRVLPYYYYYYMYSLQNAGMLTGCEKFGEHGWYREGALTLLEKQKPDGYWDRWLKPLASGMQDSPEYCIANTCFALLFLTKATIPVIDDETLSACKDIMEKQKEKEEKKKP